MVFQLARYVRRAVDAEHMRVGYSCRHGAEIASGRAGMLQALYA